ncbi:MAG: ABC transporter permease, partial [Steroidobacteraceae bacterium]
MRTLFTVAAKEMLESFRERRAMLSALLVGPLFGPILLAVLISFILNKTVTEADEKTELAVSGASHAPNLVQYLEQRDVAIVRLELDTDGARAAVREGRHRLVMLIPASYADAFVSAQPAAVQLFSDGADNRTGKYASRVRQLVNGYGAQIGLTRLLARGVNPEIARAVVLDDVDVSTPAGRAMLVLGMVTYFVLFSMLIGGLYLAIDATAGERERGSLESLLTLPVQRSTLIHGKIVATCFFMLMSLAISVTALAVSLRFVPL